MINHQELFKEAGESGINMMHKICTDVWNTGKWPTEWMESIFITIPKKGCTNHRTIALVSHASKIQLKIILGRIHQKIETEISDEQAGFRCIKRFDIYLFIVLPSEQLARPLHKTL